LFAAYATLHIKVKTSMTSVGVTVATTRGSREMVFADEYQPKCGRRQEADQCAGLQRRQRRGRGLMSKRADLFWLGSTAVSYFVASRRQDQGRRQLHRHFLHRRGDAQGIGHGGCRLQAAIQHLIDNGTYRRSSPMGPGGGSDQAGAVEPDERPRNDPRARASHARRGA
jgi:hypothetical protein